MFLDFPVTVQCTVCMSGTKFDPQFAQVHLQLRISH